MQVVQSQGHQAALPQRTLGSVRDSFMAVVGHVETQGAQGRKRELCECLVSLVGPVNVGQGPGERAQFFPEIRSGQCAIIGNWCDLGKAWT